MRYRDLISSFGADIRGRNVGRRAGVSSCKAAMARSSHACHRHIVGSRCGGGQNCRQGKSLAAILQAECGIREGRDIPCNAGSGIGGID